MTATAISEPCPGERDRPVVMFVDGDNEVRIRKREDTPSSCGLVSIEDSAYLRPLRAKLSTTRQLSPRNYSKWSIFPSSTSARNEALGCSLLAIRNTAFSLHGP